MLDQNDIKKIGEEVQKIVEERVVKVEERVDKMEERVVKKVIQEVGKMIEDNILPQFEEIHGRMDKLESTVANLPDKAFLVDKLADLEGVTVARQRKEDQKVNLLISFLATKRVLDAQEVTQLQQFQIFPSLPLVDQK